MKKLFIVLALAFLPACAVSKFSAPVAENPIPKMVKSAPQNYAVIQHSETAAEFRNSWPVYSIFALGWSRTYTKAEWDGKELKGWTYFKLNGLGSLFIPNYMDLGGGYYGAAIKPLMRSEFEYLMQEGGVEYEKIELTHGHDKSEIGRSGPFKP